MRSRHEIQINLLTRNLSYEINRLTGEFLAKQPL